VERALLVFVSAFGGSLALWFFEENVLPAGSSVLSVLSVLRAAMLLVHIFTLFAFAAAFFAPFGPLLLVRMLCCSVLLAVYAPRWRGSLVQRRRRRFMALVHPRNGGPPGVSSQNCAAWFTPRLGSALAGALRLRTRPLFLRLKPALGWSLPSVSDSCC